VKPENLENYDVVIDNLRFVYPPPKKVEAIKRMNLKFKQGEFIGIIGHNGSGKSTLSKLISGFLDPTEGSIAIGGKEVSKIHPRVRPAVVGYVFQNPDHQVFKESVWEDVEFGLKNLNYSPKDVETITYRTLEKLDLLHVRELHPFRLGKGDRQRLAVAGILVMSPKVLIVDEPTTGQDPERARQIMRLLTELNREQKITIITVTHAMDLVVEFCKRVVVLGLGEVLLDGTPSEVFSKPEILAKTYVQPPQIIRLGLALGLDPLPLRVEEVVKKIIQLEKAV
jgi:energy-coupling factor transporter ATP-binding protein EcfA2